MTTYQLEVCRRPRGGSQGSQGNQQGGNNQGQTVLAQLSIEADNTEGAREKAQGLLGEDYTIGNVKGA